MQNHQQQEQGSCAESSLHLKGLMHRPWDLRAPEDLLRLRAQGSRNSSCRTLLRESDPHRLPSPQQGVQRNPSSCVGPGLPAEELRGEDHTVRHVRLSACKGTCPEQTCFQVQLPLKSDFRNKPPAAVHYFGKSTEISPQDKFSQKENFTLEGR